MEFPQDFTARERALLGARFDELYAYATPQPARGVTVNALRCTPEWFAQHADFDAKPSPFCPTAFTTAADFRPGGTPGTTRACSMHRSRVPGPRCAAGCAARYAGGRPLRRARRQDKPAGGGSAGQGLLLANEFVAARAEILRQNLERMGVANAIITNEDTARLAAAMPGRFDRVLVDAPCSGEGMFRKEAVAAAQHNNALVAHCAELGPKFSKTRRRCWLRAACSSTRPAHLPRRRTRNRSRPSSQSTPSSPSVTCRPAVLAARARATAPRTTRTSTPNIPAASGLPTAARGILWRSCKGSRRRRAHPAESQAAQGAESSGGMARLCQDLLPGAGSRPLAGRGAAAAPGSETLNTAKLRAVRGGVLVGSVLKKRFQPAHALFMAYGTQCTNREELTLADPRTAAWLRGEEIDAATAQNGWCAVLVDGFPLGGGKVSGGRIKIIIKGSAESAIIRCGPLEKHDLLCYNNLLVIIGCNAVACVNTN